MAEGPIPSTAAPVPVGCSWPADDLFREPADGGGRRHLSDQFGAGPVLWPVGRPLPRWGKPHRVYG